MAQKTQTQTRILTAAIVIMTALIVAMGLSLFGVIAADVTTLSMITMAVMVIARIAARDR